MTEKAAKRPQEDPCDSSVVLRAHLRWLESVEDVTGSSGHPVGHVWRNEEGTWQLAFAIQRGRDRRQRHFVVVDPDGVRQDRWGLMKLGSGIWDVPESIFIEGQIHAFVTLTGVPDPAPWER